MFAAGLLLWAVVSLYLINSLVRESSQLQVTLQDSLAALLDYQSRYDSVYETAYNTTPVTSPTPATVAATAPQPLNVRKVLPEPQLVSGDLKDWPLRVKRPLFTATGEELVLQVQLQNRRKGKTARGQVQAQAKLIHRDGTEAYAIDEQHQQHQPVSHQKSQNTDLQLRATSCQCGAHRTHQH